MAHERKKLRGDASVMVAVNVPARDDKEYEAHAKRVVHLLGNGGYDAHAMTNEFVLQMADGIRVQMAQAQQTAAHLEAVAQEQTEQTGEPDGSQGS